MDRTTTLAGLSFILLAMASYPSPAQADEDDWTIKLDTQTFHQQFQYKGSTLNDVAKVTVSYTAKKDPQAQPKPYEHLWYHDGKPIGLQRLGKFGLKQSEGALIKVDHKGNFDTEQQKAAANAILRLTLDAYHNANAVTYILVPDESFDSICGELERQNCVEAHDEVDTPSKAKVVLSMVARDSLKTRHLAFY